MKKMPTADQVQSNNNFMSKRHKIQMANSAECFNKVYKIYIGGGEAPVRYDILTNVVIKI
jgi:hypothetical protein